MLIKQLLILKEFHWFLVSVESVVYDVDGVAEAFPHPQHTTKEFTI